jgi:hypothetical protein
MMQTRNMSLNHPESTSTRMRTNDLRAFEFVVALRVTKRARTSGAMSFERVVGS